MRKIIYLLLILLLKQIIGNSQASYSQNFVMTNTVKQSGITSEGMVPGLPIATQGKSQTISYIDGLGRPLQTVVTQGSATQKDIIAGVEYDNFGREIKKYLPYADISNTATPGSYKAGWQTTQAGFYNGQLQGVDADASPYSQAVLESSPLNRLLAQGAPGTAWQPNMGIPYDDTKKTVQLKYEINTVADNVRIFNVNMSTGIINSPAAYEAGQLTVKVSKDEHQGTVKEFTDKSGHIILKQVYIENDVLQTYYIYDDLDLLRAVIQPEGVAAVPATGSWTPDNQFIFNWMFVYTYDARNRMVSKHVPGSKPVIMMYDQWDRLVITQAMALGASWWVFTKYDALNRPIITGKLYYDGDTALFRTQMASLDRYETVQSTYDVGYTMTNTFPNAASYGFEILTITHYDSYDNIPSWKSGFGFVAENGVTTTNNNLQGQVVATETRVLNTNDYIRTVIYYDDKYRPIQTTSNNIVGGKDRITSILTFDGKPTAEYHSHTSDVYTTALVTTKTYSYDHADRLLKVTHKIGTGEIVTLTENSYNEMGQLLNKKLHQSTSHPSELQKLDYSYNIRGWLNGVNQPNANGTGYEENDLFNFKLSYSTTQLQGGTAQYNGNIAEQVWKGGYDEYARGYKYTYDKANRLKGSDYGIKYNINGNAADWNYTLKYNENIPSYDRNGNILKLNRYHGNLNIVDSLTYSYIDTENGNINDGNRLHRVADAMGQTVNAGFFDYKEAPIHYRYTDAGSVFYDANKGAFMGYNHLNLPYHIDVYPGNTIDYLYDAAGNKLQKKVTDVGSSPSKITITNYVGSYVYTNSYPSNASPLPTQTLEFISQDEGRIRPAKIDTTQPLTAANTKYIYDYFLKDHLGNTRMLLTTEQQTDFYAATQEPANMVKEDLLFNNMSSNAIAKSAIETAGQHFDNNASNTKVTKLNGNNVNTRVGPSIILKVMAGDTISISTKAWYKDVTQAPVTNLGPIADQLVTLLQAGMLNEGAMRHGATEYGDYLLGSYFSFHDFLNNDQPYISTRPKAFLNWMIVDEEFKKVNSSLHAGAKQVPPDMDGSQLAATLVGLNNLTVKRGGWLYVYLSNESNQDVYFDDLVVNHKRGPVVQQTNYYAFGLEIPGLASNALAFGGTENRYKYNGKELQSKEFSNGTGLEWTDYGARMYDAQIGRWMVVDPLSEVSRRWSPYNYAYSNPIRFVDPDGMAVQKFDFNQSYGGYNESGRPENFDLYGKDRPYYLASGGEPKRKVINGQSAAIIDGKPVPAQDLAPVVVSGHRKGSASIDATYVTRGTHIDGLVKSEGESWEQLEGGLERLGYVGDFAETMAKLKGNELPSALGNLSKGVAGVNIAINVKNGNYFDGAIDLAAFFVPRLSPYTFAYSSIKNVYGQAQDGAANDALMMCRSLNMQAIYYENNGQSSAAVELRNEAVRYERIAYRIAASKQSK